jgi:hypothetical protein
MKNEEVLGNCVTEDPDLFFPESQKEYVVKVPLAKKICEGCPIVLSCFSTAYTNEYPGIWGGTTERERKDFRRSPRQRRLFIDSITPKK